MSKQHVESLRAGLWFLFLILSPLLACSSVLDEYAEASDAGAADGFVAARKQTYTLQGTTVFPGSMHDAQDVQIWDLGAVDRGSRVVVDVDGQGADLSIGLFNQDGQVLIINRDRYGGRDPLAVLDLHGEDLRQLFLVVSRESAGVAAGAYTVTLTHSDVPMLMLDRPQEVILNFWGGRNVTIGNVFHGAVWPFDAANLNPDWSGHTEEMKNLILAELERIYDGLDVTFRFGDELNRPAEASIIYFGGAHASNVGLAASVDYGNRLRDQVAIVYTENFEKYVQYGYSYTDLAHGFANVAAHELGHLLGLNHTDLAADVMNVSPTVAALMMPQYFVAAAALDPAVFPMGLQDGAERILTTVGGEWDQVVQSRSRSAAMVAGLLPEAIPPHSTSNTAAGRLSSAVNCESSHAD